MNIRTSTSLVAWCLLAALSPAVVSAQEQAESPAASAKIHLGGLGITPTFGLRNVGVDTNVFNEAVNPRRDFTATLVPGALTWLQIRRLQLSGKTGLEWVFFARSSQQRSFNFGQELRFDVPTAHVTPSGGGQYGTTRQRLNAELDERVRRKTKSLFLGTSIAIGSRTSLALEVRRTALDYADQTFQGVSLQRQLNRRLVTISGAWKIELTPLTTFTVRAEREQDRFEFLGARDANSWSLVPGVEMKPVALISGTARVGFRRFRLIAAGTPSFSGVIAGIDLRYSARETTRFGFKVDRDVDFSFEVASPYFLSTSVELSALQVVGGDWDIVGRVGRQGLDYRQTEGPGGLVTAEGRRDRLASVGFGAGYHLDFDSRIGFDVDYGRRESPVASRRYHGFKVGGSFTYGF